MSSVNVSYGFVTFTEENRNGKLHFLCSEHKIRRTLLNEITKPIAKEIFRKKYFFYYKLFIVAKNSFPKHRD